MTICIYHGNCTDGFGSAWVVRKAGFSQMEFIPCTHGQEPPDVTDQDVIMVDFSYKRPVLLEMAAKAKSILILDHHETAQQDLVDLPSNVHTIFDMNRSGVMITWDYFFPNISPPRLLEHIQDQDLWRFALANTRYIQSNLFSYPYDFEVWDKLMETDVSELIADGVAINRKQSKDINELLKVTVREMEIGGYKIPVTNLPYTYGSDAGAILAEGVAFAAVYYDTTDGRSFSLRSSLDGVNVAKIAEQYGGGGHPHAAGFRVSFDHILGNK